MALLQAPLEFYPFSPAEHDIMCDKCNCDIHVHALRLLA